LFSSSCRENAALVHFLTASSIPILPSLTLLDSDSLTSKSTDDHLVILHATSDQQVLITSRENMHRPSPSAVFRSSSSSKKKQYTCTIHVLRGYHRSGKYLKHPEAKDVSRTLDLGTENVRSSAVWRGNLRQMSIQAGNPGVSLVFISFDQPTLTRIHPT
jgi:hypothetical protein